MSATQTTQNHFNLHTNGVGYLNRVRWVPVSSRGRKAEPFLSCSIAAMRGDGDKPDYTYLDLKVVGETAIDLIDSFAEDANNGRKVVVAFKVGDIYPHLYERKVKGSETGEMEAACLIKGRLLFIYSVTVDGERVYTRPPAEEAQDDNLSAPAAQGDNSLNDSEAAPSGSPEDLKPVEPIAQAQQPERQSAPQGQRPQPSTQIGRASCRERV